MKTQRMLFSILRCGKIGVVNRIGIFMIALPFAMLQLDVSKNWIHSSFAEEATERSKDSSVVAAIEIPRKEYFLEVQKLVDSRQVDLIKKELLERLPENTTVVERQIARGQIVLAIRSSAEIFEIKDAVYRLPLGTKKLKTIDSDEVRVRVEIQ